MDIPLNAASRARIQALTLQDTGSPPPMPRDIGEPLTCDTRRKFVRVLERCDNGLVRFEFSIGWPELAVELLLPSDAFEAFCQTHQVERLDT